MPLLLVAQAKLLRRNFALSPDDRTTSYSTLDGSIQSSPPGKSVRRQVNGFRPIEAGRLPPSFHLRAICGYDPV